MHRVPLPQLKQLSIFWDRNEPESVLFSKALNKDNVAETENFLLILDREAIKYQKNTRDWALNLYLKTRALFMEKPFKDSVSVILKNFTNIILRGPVDSASFLNALKLRGQLFMESQMVFRAMKDYEICLCSENLLSYEDLCEINGYLSICSLVMRHFNKAKIYYEAYLNYKKKLSFMVLRQEILLKIEKTLEKFKDDIAQLNIVPPDTQGTEKFCIPYCGFNSCTDIPLSSSVCYLKNVTDAKGLSARGVFTHEEVGAGSIVFVEHSFEIGVHTPMVQCEYCLSRDLAVYTCLKCRYKTYCSLDCINKDKESHKDECIGYFTAVFLILDAVPLFRIFLRLISVLSKFVFGQKNVQQMEHAHEILLILPNEIERLMLSNDRHMAFIGLKPFYQKLSDTQYSTLIATTLRLTIFVDRNTAIIDKNLKNLRLSNKEKLILVGSLLMRIQCHILLNTFDFEFEFPILEEIGLKKTEIYYDDKKIKPFTEPPAENIDAYYKISRENDLESYLEMLACADDSVTSSQLQAIRHTNECNPIQRLLSTYKDKITEICITSNSKDFLLFTEAAIVPTTDLTANLMNNVILSMTTEERYSFMENFIKLFHECYSDYFISLTQSSRSIPQVISSLCTTLSKFQHSCDPNVEVVLLKNGFILGKSLRRIEKNEELFVSYKAHYLRHTRHERYKYLSKLNITCECDRCHVLVENEPTNLRSGVKCHICRIEITPTMSKCYKCNTYYTKEMLCYRKELKTIEKRIEKEEDERELYLLHLCLYELVKKNFSEYHETCIDMQLKYVKFLAMKNAASEAFNIIMEIKEKILDAYREDEVWFSFFDYILSIIKILLTYNIDKELRSLPACRLLELCELGHYIVKGQQNYVFFYETYDFYCKKLVASFNQLSNWENCLLTLECAQDESDKEDVIDVFGHTA